MTIRLASHNGKPVPIYRAIAGEIVAQDGRRIEFVDCPTLIVANASQALQLHAHGRIATAKRFAKDARDMFAAFEEARAWRAASSPVNREKA